MKNAETKNNLKKICIFHKPDIILYAFCAILAAVLFCVFVFPVNSSPISGFKVLIGQTEIYSYVYGDEEKINIDRKQYIEVSGKKDGVFTVKIYTDKNKESYNVLSVNDKEKSVRVISSNCSKGMDCVYTPPLSDSGGAIICVPHNLKVLPLGDGYLPPVTG